MSSPFGSGPATFRRGWREGPADTVYLGVFDRAALASVGGFDETLERNQDYELNWRMRERGHIVWLDPHLVVDYVPRPDLSGLARQYFAYGSWKRAVLMRHPRSLRSRQLAPPALVGGLAASAVALASRRWGGAALPVLYAAACTIAAFGPAARAAGSARPGSGCGRLRGDAPWMGRRLPGGPDPPRQPGRSAGHGGLKIGGHNLAGFAHRPQSAGFEPCDTIAGPLDLDHVVGHQDHRAGRRPHLVDALRAAGPKSSSRPLEPHRSAGSPGSVLSRSQNSAGRASPRSKCAWVGQ